MAAKHILAALAALFLIAAMTRLIRTRYSFDAATRTWLTVAVIFAVVSCWLWIQT